jgi:hypothetical protein
MFRLIGAPISRPRGAIWAAEGVAARGRMSEQRGAMQAAVVALGRISELHAAMSEAAIGAMSGRIGRT